MGKRKRQARASQKAKQQHRPPSPSLPRTAADLVERLNDFLPLDISWLVASYDADVEERCGSCNELFGKRAIDFCMECQEDFHTTTCLTRDEINQHFCGDCLKCLETCVYCNGTIISSDSHTTCNICDEPYHRECGENDVVVWQRYQEEICHDCFWKDPIECSRCEEDISKYMEEKAVCPKCEEVVCDNCTSSRGLCRDCDAIREEERKARSVFLTESLAALEVEVRSDSKIFRKFVEKNKPTIEEATQRICQGKFFHEFCDWDRVYVHFAALNDETLEAGYFPDSMPHEEANLFFAKLLPRSENDWPWLKGITPEQFRASEAYQKTLDSLKDHTFV